MNNRLIELDILRGLSVFGMVIVINPGNWSHQFGWMRHAEWQGFPLSDMIFPAFLLCIGFSISLSFSKRIEKGHSYFHLVKKILIRSLLMIGIGLFINAFPYFDWSNMRIPGVIQRIGLCYLLSANIYLIILVTRARSRVLWLLIVATLILIGYFVLLLFIPITNTPRVGNFYIWPALIDQNVFGINHIWPYEKINGLIPYDPDGLLASVPATVNILLGLILGEITKYYTKYYKVKYILLSGIMLITLGFVLDYYGIMLIVKKFWTSSFVLFSVGFSLLLLALIKQTINKLSVGIKLFHPFIIFGSNALLAFVVSYLCMALMDKSWGAEITFRQLGFDFLQQFVSDPKWASFLFSILPLTVYFIGLRFMYVKHWFVKL